jgi:hypothetical protein
VFPVHRIERRFLFVAHKRRIGRLLLVTGPPACGKSTTVERLMRGEGGEVAAACDFDAPSQWQESDSLRIHNDGCVRVDRLLFHLDLFRPSHRCPSVRHRPELDLIDCADRVQVATLLVRPAILRRRIEDRLASLRPGQARQGDKLREVLRVYERPERVARLIREWDAYCASRGIEPIYIDNSETPPRRIARDRWERIILEG